MKKAILIFLLTASWTLCKAQQTPKETAVSIKLLPSQLSQLQQVISFSFQWLPKSDAPAKDVGLVLEAIQKLYPALIADTIKNKPLNTKKP